MFTEKCGKIPRKQRKGLGGRKKPGPVSPMLAALLLKSSNFPSDALSSLFAFAVLRLISTTCN